MRVRNFLLGLLVLCFAFPSFADDEETIHIIQPGETLFRIALRYGVSMSDLAIANQIANPSNIYVGERLVIPGLSAPTSGVDVDNPLVATAPIIHIVRRGEYLSQIASLYHVSLGELMRANNLTNPNIVSEGQELQIWSPDLSIPLEVPEDVLAESVETVTDNPLEIVEVTPEAIEVIETPSPEVSTAESTEADLVEAANLETTPEVAATEAPEEHTATHVVQWGEHLASIAQRYGVSWSSIAEANGITNANYIRAGMVLTIPNVSPNYITNAASNIQNVRSIAENLEPVDAHWGEGRELVVDLSTQMAYAYEDGELMYSALVSTGLPATPTVRGEYAVYHKLESQTMSGPGYYLPGVEWVMYFYAGYGFHGTYWHENFGQPMSHGCVNMRNEDALWFYEFADIGTNVWVQW